MLILSPGGLQILQIRPNTHLLNSYFYDQNVKSMLKTFFLLTRP